MTILVIGAGGQVGRALLRQAADRADVVGWYRVDLDLGNLGAIASKIAELAPATIINAAAYTAVDQAESDVDRAFAINRDAAGAIAAAARDTHARMIHLSTDFVFDGRASSPYSPEAIRSPLGVYGASKAAGELAVLAACPDALVVRTAWVYGAGGKNFVNTMLRLMSTRDILSVVADQVGTPTHAASLARALWALVPGQLSGVHHFTDAGVASWYDFAVAVRDIALQQGILASKTTIVPVGTPDYPTPAPRPAYSVLDKSSLWSALGGPSAHWRAELENMLLNEGISHAS